jgi:hypothetical protein
MTALYRPGTRWQELLEVSPDLEALGIRVDQPLREAQSRVPHARYLPLDEATVAAIESEFTDVLDVLGAFSPIVEPAPREELGAGRALAYVDVAGLGALYGAEPEIGRRLAAAGDAGGGTALTGIAGGKFAAWVAASEGHRSVVVVPPGREAAFLAPLPLDRLPLRLRTRQALHRVGARTLGTFAALPANAVRHRYGIEGLAAHALAQGRDDRPLRARRTRPVAVAARSFEWDETDLDRIGFTVKLLADELAARLLRLEGGERDANDDPADDLSDALPPEGDSVDDWPEDYSQVIPDEDLGEPTTAQKEPGWAARLAAQRWGTRQIVPEQRKKNSAAEKTPRFVVEGLRVRWQLSGGEEREALLRLAEPAGTAAAFTEHLRWHLEALDRLLLPDDDEAEESESGPGYTYERIDRRAGVTAITLEAVGIGLPTGTQLKLLTPVGRTSVDTGTIGRMDAATRARHARRGIARVQARWGMHAARAAASSIERLPEARLRLLEPEIGLQLEAPGGTLAASGREGPLAASRADDAAPLSSELPMWLIDPPESVAIRIPRKGGRRVLVRRTPTRCPGQPALRGPLEARIVRAGGPWKVVDTRALALRDPLHRDYYQVELEDGGAYLIFWDRVADRWFLQGVFI